MKVLSMAVATSVNTIARLSMLARPNFFIEDKVGNPLIFFKLLEYLGTVNPVLGVVSCASARVLSPDGEQQ
jgi:hypothetical protein